MPVILSGRIRDRVPSFRCLLISTSAAVAFLATGPSRAQTAAPPAHVAQNLRELPAVKIEAPRTKPQTRAKKPGGRLSTTAAPPSPGAGPSNGEALAGVAPINRESGQYRGKRMIAGGRAFLRSMLYLAGHAARMGNATLRAFADRLEAAGKARKVIRIALARKLLIIANAVLRDNKAWMLKTA